MALSSNSLNFKLMFFQCASPVDTVTVRSDQVSLKFKGVHYMSATDSFKRASLRPMLEAGRAA